MWTSLLIIMAIYLLIDVLISYLIGSIPTGYLIVKAKTGQDIRKIGSGSTGATNVKRVLGKKWFFIVMFLDAFKGALPVILARYFTISVDLRGIFPVVASIFVIIGHSKPIFLQFKGGKSVASGVGTILALNPLVGLSIALIWGIITYFSKYVSLGSIVALAFSPVLMYLFKMPVCYIIYCAIAWLYIVYLHNYQIKQLTN